MTREFIPAPKGFVIERIDEDTDLQIVRYRFSLSMTLDIAISISAEKDSGYRQMTLEHGIRQLARGAGVKLVAFAA